MGGWVGGGGGGSCEPILGYFRIPAQFHFGTFVGPIRSLIQMFGILVFKLIRKEIRKVPPHPALARPGDPSPYAPIPFLLSSFVPRRKPAGSIFKRLSVPEPLFSVTGPISLR